MSKNKKYVYPPHTLDHENEVVVFNRNKKKTKKAFKEFLNKKYPFNKNDTGKGKNGRYKSTKRAYGDYLYSADKEMFDIDYEEWLKNE